VLSSFRQILVHVLYVRTFFQAMPDRTQAAVAAKEQLKSAFEASSLLFDEVPALIGQLEEEASRMLQGGQLILN
jgi:hypothetical protein